MIKDKMYGTCHTHFHLVMGGCHTYPNAVRIQIRPRWCIWNPNRRCSNLSVHRPRTVPRTEEDRSYCSLRGWTAIPRRTQQQPAVPFVSFVCRTKIRCSSRDRQCIFPSGLRHSRLCWSTDRKCPPWSRVCFGKLQAMVTRQTNNKWHRNVKCTLPIQSQNVPQYTDDNDGNCVLG